MRLLSILLTCVAASLLSACGGGGGGGGGSAAQTSASANPTTFPMLATAPANNQVMASCQTNAAPDALSTLTGTVMYQRVPIDDSGLDYNNIRDLPARGVVVQAVDGTGGTCGSAIVASALTNGSGQYGLIVPTDQPVCLEVRAQLYRDSSSGGPGWDIQVVDNTRGNAAYYLVDHSPDTPTNRPVRNLLAGSGAVNGVPGYSSPRAAAPFAVLDSLCEAVDTVLSADPGADLPLLTVAWSPGNTLAEGNIEDGDLGGSFFQETRYIDGFGNVVDREFNMYLLGDVDSDTDEYDPHVINHEYGHYLTSVLTRVDTIGGSHSVDDRLDPRVAFDEGFATAFAGITLTGSNPVIADGLTYRDSLGPDQSFSFRFRIDSNTSSRRGWYSERTVYSTVYNAFDAVDDAFDTLSLGLTPIMAVLASSDYRDSDSLLILFTFFNVLKQQVNPADAFKIDTLLADQNIEPVSDDFGSGEVVANNDVMSFNDVDPIYLSASAGVALQACSNYLTYGDYYNKLANGRFIRFTPPSAGNWRFQFSPLNSGRAAVKIYRKGDLVAEQEAGFRGATLAVNADIDGPVVVVLYDYDNFNEGGIPGRYCFDVVIN